MTLLSPWLDHFTVIPLYLACVTIPVYGLVQMQAGIAQSYDWPNLALMPFYIWRQLIITVLMGGAWAVRRADRRGDRHDRRRRHHLGGDHRPAFRARPQAQAESARPDRSATRSKTWLATSLPIFVVEGFYLLLTYVDILALEHLRSPDEVAVYYAAARLLALVAFVYFAIAGATTHKFTQYHVAGDTERLAKFFAETIRWTFWPSLAACAADPRLRQAAAVAVRRQLRAAATS